NLTYAFEILTTDEPDNILYNLIVTQRVDGKEIPAFIIKYEFKNATKHDYATPTEKLKFEAKTSIYSYEKFIQTGTLQSKGTTNSKDASSGTDPCIEINNTTSNGGGGGGNDHLSGGNFTEQTSTVGGIGGFGIYTIPSSGSGGGKSGKVICGELIMLGNKVNSAYKIQNTKTQAKGTAGNDPCPYGEILLPVNKNPEQIINNLSGKALCIYNKLNSSSASFVNAIKKFDGNFPVSHLKFEIDPIMPSNTKRAYTRAPENYVIDIVLNGNPTKEAGYQQRPNLLVAKTIIHEVIHAEMFRKLLSLANDNGSINVSLINQMLHQGDYPGMLDYYFRNGEDINSSWQHQQMAAHYRETIGRALQVYDTGIAVPNNQQPSQLYMDLAWEGLNHS